MKRRLSVRAIAEIEIEDARAWYEERRSHLGAEFLVEVKRGLRTIEEAPERFPVIRGRVRRCLLKRFPYSLLFVAEQQHIVVIACFHAKRDPRRWHDRG